MPLATIGLLFFLLPLVGLFSRVPLRRFPALLSHPGVLDALRLSLLCATSALALAFIIGFPLAWILARYSFPGHNLLRAIVTLPMVLPPVVAGVALLTALGRRGLLGASLSALGIELPFTTAGAIIAATFVAAPFLIVTLESALQGLDRRPENAAATMGASPMRILWTITIPSIRPSILAGMALAWARALGEFGATITFAGNYRGRTQTMPLAVYEILQEDQEAAIVLSLILLVASVTILAALRGKLARR